MDKNFRRQVMGVVKDMKRQMGEDNSIARYIASAVIAKLCTDNLKSYIEITEKEN